MTTGRLEAFSDGVIAVAATLLVLNIVVPPPEKTPKLGHALVQMWPVYSAYAVSFTTIGIIWINHHAMISRLAQADRAILILNLLLLMTIAVLPFATALIAAYLKQGHGEKLAAAVYAGAFLLMSVAFTALNLHILRRKAHLLGESIPEERRRHIEALSIAGVAPYAVATAVAAVSPYATLIICASIAVYYATPFGSGG